MTDNSERSQIPPTSKTETALTDLERYCSSSASALHSVAVLDIEIERLTRELDKTLQDARNHQFAAQNNVKVANSAVAERDRLLARCAELERFNVGLATESERRRAALKKYGGHTFSCATQLYHHPARACDCGFTALSGEPSPAHETDDAPGPCSCGRVRERWGRFCAKVTCADGSEHTQGGCNSPSKASEPPSTATGE